LFKLPPNYTTLLKDSEKDEGYWDEIINKIFHISVMEAKYCEQPCCYIQLGPPNTSHFIGRNSHDNYLIASTKKGLLFAMAL
jgi:hypothetical protein